MKSCIIFLENIFSNFFPFCLLIVVGIYISFKGDFFQFKGFSKSVKLTLKAFGKKENTNEGISSFQAACTALSGTVGTGNIAGVAGALSIGGAGAVFWMWISAFLGMAIKFVEVTLSIKYRECHNKKYIGGPMYYVKNGLSKKFEILAFIYSLVALPAVIFTGNITQINAATFSVSDNFFIRLIIGIIFSLLVLFVVLGGNKRIGNVTEKIVPIMSLIYILLTFGVIFLNYKNVPHAFLCIFKGAFSPSGVTGGVVGSFIVCAFTGASRGIFSNEAGLGTSAMAHSVAYDAETQTQGYYGIFEVFLDTIVICTLTALTILCSGVNIEYGTTSDARLVIASMFSTYGKVSSILIAIMMLIFAFSSIIGWALYGGICTEFLTNKKVKNLFFIIYPIFCVIGSVCNADTAWRFSAFFNGIMLCINLPIIVLLFDKSLVKR